MTIGGGRKGSYRRETKETSVEVDWDLDGSGAVEQDELPVCVRARLAGE